MGDSEIAEHSQRFFKTGPGEYRKGDQFLGIRIFSVRKVAGQFKGLSLEETKNLLHSDYHKERLCALIMLVNKSKKTEPDELKKIFDLYPVNTDYVNNWDLVDTSAEHIVSAYLSDKDRSILYEQAKSDNLLDRRITILSTFLERCYVMRFLTRKKNTISAKKKLRRHF